MQTIRHLTLASALAWLTACTALPPVVALPKSPPETAPLAEVVAPVAEIPALQRPSRLYELAQPVEPAFSELPTVPKPVPADRFSLESPPEIAPVTGVFHEFERGGASWYGASLHGRRTASGERYDMHELTAAHRTLPFGTIVRVRSLVNGREVDVRITDRGPFAHSRVIDVSHAAALQLDMLGLGFKEVVLLVSDAVPEPPLAVAKVVKRGRKARRASGPVRRR